MNRVDELLQAHAPWSMSDRTWPLTPFERFMWCDDRPHAPLVFQVALCFDGPIDADTMREAFRFALGRHPLLRSTIRSRGRAADWVARATGWREMTVHTLEQDDAPGFHAIDLTTSGGLHGWMQQTSCGWDINLLFHHACCDGQGARMFIQDMVLAYAFLRGESRETSPFFPIDINHLNRRGLYPEAVGRAQTWAWKVQQFVEFFFHPPKPTAIAKAVRAEPTQPQHDGVKVGMCSYTFSSEEVAQLQDPQRRSGASLNDVAVATLFSVISRWQQRHGLRSRSWVRITVPCDLRGREDERMPAANRYTYLFLNRRLRGCGNWHAVLPGVQAELQEKLQTRFGVNFLAKLTTLVSRPRLMRWVLGGRFCFATAVLTNLSDPSRRLRKRLPVDADGFFWLAGARCYDLQVRTPPLRPKTHWGVGIFEYAGRMTVTFRYDTDTISPGDAEQVLADYIEGWRQWLAETAG
jgi:hypothetical protein